MRRKNKYGTNKTIRFCQKYLPISLPQNHSPEQLCIDKRGRWKIMDFLKEHTQSSDYSNKIILRRNYNFFQYNGYKSVLRENPPQHLSFARRPDFVYQPYVNFIKVNQNILNLALLHGWKIFKNRINLADLLDIDSPDTPVTLIYFLDDLKHFCLSDWLNAQKHAFGGHFAAYHTVCSGDYCPFGPRIRGIETSDSRINQVLLITGNYKKLERCFNCTCDSWNHSTKLKRHCYKKERSRVKIQRQEKYKLTKQAKAAKS
jgi:hypothetical protein